MNKPSKIYTPQKIAVGSTNPVKVSAVRSVVERAWPKAEILQLDAESGVSAMPMSDDECITGARNRAVNALNILDADLGIGLEGGVNLEPNGLVLLGWVAALDKNGHEGLGGGARLPLPSQISSRILAGEELGPLMDELLGQKDVKQKGGAVGALTSGLVLRTETFAIAVAYALAPFVSPEFYGE